jgi:hypothetical protein
LTFEFHTWEGEGKKAVLEKAQIDFRVQLPPLETFDFLTQGIKQQAYVISPLKTDTEMCCGKFQIKEHNFLLRKKKCNPLQLVLRNYKYVLP